MSRFKKIFIIISCFILVIVSTFLITVNNIRSNVTIAIGKPYSIVIFDHATTGVESKEESLFNNLSEQMNNTTNLTVFEKFVNKIPLDKRIYQDSKNKYAKWSTDLLNNNLVVEIIYSSMQDLVVYEDEYSRVISYYCLSFVIPTTTDFTEIAVYYSFTSNTDNNEKDKSYQDCTPLILYGNAEELSEFVKSIKK